MVELTVTDSFEALDSLFDRHEDALESGEDLANEERLRQELLDLAGPADSELVLLRKFVNTKDGDDVLKFFVSLQNLLCTVRNCVVTITYDLRCEDR